MRLKNLKILELLREWQKKESPSFTERFVLVEKPEEYYVLLAFLDLIEFLFRLNKILCDSLPIVAALERTWKVINDYP